MTDLETSFHAGELAVQRRAEVPFAKTEMASTFIRPAMPQQHRDFFESLPILFLGGLDRRGRVWATAAMGSPGFIGSPSPRTMTLGALPVLAGELDLSLDVGAKIGAVGIELATRRRNRVNATVRQAAGGGLALTVDQSFGNCPQYIQIRQPAWDDHDLSAIIARRLSGLDEPARDIIARADMFIIASRSRALSDDPRSGVDASHRGGRPGFLGQNPDGTLSFPDFSGNRFFNTLGNIEDDGRVGLFIPDFTTGSALLLTGRASVDWNGARVAAFEGAERIVDIRPEEVWMAEHVLPARTALIEAWPPLKGTGTWAQTRRARSVPDGWRRYEIEARVAESAEITSFHLAPVDGLPLPAHVAGQFLPIRLDMPDGPILRSYTISQATNGRTLRLSVKREPGGTASRILHDRLAVGDRIDAADPAGDFVLDEGEQPIVFLSAGVGITPMIAMLEAQIAAVESGARPRDIWFFHAARTSRGRPFDAYLQEVARRYGWFHLHRVNSRPEAEDEAVGRTHESEGALSIEILARLLPFGGYQFYLCGPDGFMRTLYAGLRKLGIDRSHIRHEFFGAGELEEGERNRPAAAQDLPETAPVRFAASETAATWMPGAGSLLDLAEGTGLSPSFSCRDGKCGTCATRVITGDVAYTRPPAFPAPEGHVFICCSVPASAEGLELDL
ncbi:pyridoxamine 5'-phosphate oxidase family protein [Amaricoccus macauensis]|uniref:FAD-binding oxidoreductase n=1 Tax=Amaricoccus macauensis TaxID=57001 RepID=UPI003C7DD7D5